FAASGGRAGLARSFRCSMDGSCAREKSDDTESGDDAFASGILAQERRSIQWECRRDRILQRSSRSCWRTLADRDKHSRRSPVPDYTVRNQHTLQKTFRWVRVEARSLYYEIK